MGVVFEDDAKKMSVHLCHSRDTPRGGLWIICQNQSQGLGLDLRGQGRKNLVSRHLEAEPLSLMPSSGHTTLLMLHLWPLGYFCNWPNVLILAQLLNPDIGMDSFTGSLKMILLWHCTLQSDNLLLHTYVYRHRRRMHLRRLYLDACWNANISICVTAPACANRYTVGLMFYY